jgi:hypothetical protein
MVLVQYKKDGNFISDSLHTLAQHLNISLAQHLNTSILRALTQHLNIFAKHLSRQVEEFFFCYIVIRSTGSGGGTCYVL